MSNDFAKRSVAASKKKLSTSVTVQPPETDSSRDNFGRGELIEQTGEAACHPNQEKLAKKTKIEMRNEAKRLKLERQSHKPNFNIVQSSKQLWEIVRQRDLSSEKRAVPLGSLLKNLTGKFKQLILQHDASRFVQTCIKYASTEQRMMIASELRGSFIEISKNKYGKHILKALLNHCPKLRDTIASEFRGKISKIIRQKESSAIIELLFSEYSNGAQKNLLLYEFYGPEFVYFSNENGKKSLRDLLAAHPDKKPFIIARIRESLDLLLSKGNIHHTLVHRLILDYASHEESRKLQEWLGVSGMEEYAVEILHTFEGSRAVCKLLSNATAKQRKTLIKSFKPFIIKIAKEEYGHQVFLTIFGIVDDTTLVKNVIICELLANFDDIITDKYGKRLFIALLSGFSNTAALSKQSTEVVKDAQALSTFLSTSKKDLDLRASELKADIFPKFLQYCIENFDFLIDNPFDSNFLIETLLAPEFESSSDLFSKLIDAISDTPERRSFYKKFARRASNSLSQSLLNSIFANPELVTLLIQSENVFILIALCHDKPEVAQCLGTNLLKMNLDKSVEANKFYQELRSKL